MAHTLIFSGNVNIARANTAQALIVPNTANRVEFDHTSIADDDIMWFSMQLTGTVGATITRPVSGAFWKGTSLRTASQGVATGNDTAVLLSGVATNFSRIDLWITRGQESVGGVNRTNRFLIQSNSATLGDAMPLLIFHQPAAAGGGGATIDQAAVYPVVKDIMVPGTNTTLTEDDSAQTIAVNSTDTNTQRTDKEIQDVVGIMVRDGGATTATYSALAGTLTISSTDTNTQRTDEDIRDVIGTALREGANVNISVDDTANTITISATDTNTQLSNEQVQDIVGSMFREGTDISISYDDTAGTVTISNTQSSMTFIPTQSNLYPIVKEIMVDGDNTTLNEDDAKETIAVDVAGQASQQIPRLSPAIPSNSSSGIGGMISKYIGVGGTVRAGELVREITNSKINRLKSGDVRSITTETYPFQGFVGKGSMWDEGNSRQVDYQKVCIVANTIAVTPELGDVLNIDGLKLTITEQMASDQWGAILVYRVKG